MRRDRMLTARVSSKGQIAIPKPVRERLGLKRGTDMAIRVEGEEVILRKVAQGSWRGWEGRYKGSRLLQDLAEERARERRRDAEGPG